MTSIWATYLMLLGATPLVVLAIELWDACKAAIVWFRKRG